MHLTRTLAAAIVLCVAAAPLAGCSTPAEDAPRQPPFGPPPDVSDPRFGVFVPERVDAVFGERMVIPVELAGDFRPADVGQVQLDDGRLLPTDLVWIGAQRSTVASLRSWLPNAGGVGAHRPGDAGAGRGEGRWVIIIDPPIDAVGQGVWLAGRRVPVNWLPDPRETALRIPSEAWSSPLPAGVRRAATLQSMLDPIRRTPSQRWRARLVSGDLTPDERRPIVEVDGSMRRESAARPGDAIPFNDAALDAVASFTEARWIIGLARLYEADTDLSVAVRRRLCSVVDFGDGAIAPVWSTDQASTQQLVDDLTDQTLSLRERARRAALWLGDQPSGMAWILSDAGRSVVAGEPLTTVALLNPTWEPAFASLEPWASGEAALLEPVPPLSVRAEEVVSRPAGASRAAVVATISDDEFQLLAGAADAIARPPGLQINGLFLDLTLDEVLSQRRTPARVDRTGVLLYLDHRERWVLYAECQTPGRTPGDDDTLIVTLGAVGSRIEADLTASADGIVGLRDGGIAGSLGQPLDAEVARYDGGWSLRLVIPDRFIEDGRAFRFGVQRRDDQGVRSAWPRAMLPWQQSAPRAAVDLARWND